MAEEQLQLLNAQELMNDYTQHIDQALSSANADEMREHVREAMSVGQGAMDNLEDALDLTDNPDLADRLEEAVNYLGRSMDEGEQVIEASDGELDDIISQMRKFAEQSAQFLSEAVSIPS